MKSVKTSQVNINHKFWKEYVDLLKNVVIPYQWESLNDNIQGAEKSHAVKNLKIAANVEEGEFHGFVFQDSDLAKWIEAVGYCIATNKYSENENVKLMEKNADSIIDYLEKAQQEDGYLNTYYIINGLEKRFTNLMDCHELYCLGHFIEGAIAYYEATGKRKILDIVCRYADLVDRTFGCEDGKIKGYPGHQEIELALVKLYDATGEVRYLNLAKYFIDERGKSPSFFIEEWEKRGKTIHWNQHDKSTPSLKYYQSDLPVREQKVAVGHAVRAVYMYTGMAHIAEKSKDESLLLACKTLWNDIVNKQLYITGGIGQTRLGEAFTYDYDLPNDTVYAETCASIGLIFFANRMLQIEQDAIYADVIEDALYNTVLGGLAKDGKHFFYVNPLEVIPNDSENHPEKTHVKSQRQPWFGCACCPPNVSRLLASLGKYIYSIDKDKVFVHLYIGNESEFDLESGKIKLTQTTNYPLDGNVKIKVETKIEVETTIALRIPRWCDKKQINVNGENVEYKENSGYAYLKKVWKNEDIVTIDLLMDTKIMQANKNVRADSGKVAIKRGPIVYCLESVDNVENLSTLKILPYEKLEPVFEEDFFGGSVTIKGKGIKNISNDNSLYSTFNRKVENVDLKFIPYHLWGNRGIGEMCVWVNYVD